MAFPGQLGDLGFLGREVDERVDRALAHGFPGGQQLAAGAFGETFHAHRGQQLVRGAKVLAGVDTAIRAAEPFVVDQMGAGQFRRHRGATEALDRLPVQAAGVLALAQQGPWARFDPERPVGAADAGGLREPPHRADPAFGRPGARGRLDQLDQTPVRRGHVREVRAGLAGGGQRTVIVAKTVAEHRGRPVADADRDALGPPHHFLPGGAGQRISLAFTATGDRPTVVLTGPRHRLGHWPGPAAGSADMVRTRVEGSPLTAAATLAWHGDLSRPLQQVLFGIASE